MEKGEEVKRDVEKDEDPKSHVIVVTDACLPLLGSAESPLCACMLINYELPTKKVRFCTAGSPLSLQNAVFTKLKCALLMPINTLSALKISHFQLHISVFAASHSLMILVITFTSRLHLMWIQIQLCWKANSNRSAIKPIDKLKPQFLHEMKPILFSSSLSKKQQ